MLGKKKMKFNVFVKEADSVYAYVKQYGKRSGSLCNVDLSDITYLPYQVLKHDVPDLLKNDHYEEAIFLILNSKEKNTNFTTIKKETNYKKFMFLLWVQDQYKAINEMEQQYLATPPDAKMLEAGIRDLDILGDVNLIDTICKGDILKWEAVRQLPYAMIFDKNLKLTIESRISKKLNKIKK